ncbi:D-aminoacylase, partial [candidate division KSB1 bacterium]|nr:D-aminoacylase [candidate division KSB1 bacterium]
MRKLLILPSILALLVACATPADYDVIIRNGVIYDGTGNTPYNGDVGITGDKIAAIGNLETATGGVEIDAEGMAVSPGFINMLS